VRAPPLPLLCLAFQQRSTASQQQQAAAVANESGVLAKRKIKEIVEQVSFLDLHSCVFFGFCFWYCNMYSSWNSY
jgi:MFS superfamily sulfate permease-like transporter